MQMFATSRREKHVQESIASSKASPLAASSPVRDSNLPPGGRLGVCPCGGGCPRCIGFHGSERSTALAAVQRTVEEPGVPLVGDLRLQMEAITGHSLASVELHTGARASAAAARINARAFTLGRHVGFGSNEFEPSTPRGRALLVHEMAHAASAATPSDGQPPRAERLGAVDDAAEHSARALAAGAFAAGTLGSMRWNAHAARGMVEAAGTVRRAPKDEPVPEDIGSKASRNATCRILFKKGRAELDNAKAFDSCLKSTRNELAAAGKEAEVILYGFASEEGTADFNQRLSEDRAATIARLFASGGVERARMRTFAYGESKTYSDVAQNRRVEVVILQQQKIAEGDVVKGQTPATKVEFDTRDDSKKDEEMETSPRYKFMRSMMDAQSIGLPTRFLNEVLAKYDIEEVGAADDNQAMPWLDKIQFRPGVMSAHFDPTAPPMSSEFGTIYHEALHAYIEDIMSDVEPFASLRAQATEHYRGTTVGEEGQVTSDPSRVAAEAAAEYVDHRVNTYWQAYSRLAALASRAKLDEAGLAKVRAEYNTAMKRRDSFGYSEEDGLQLHSSSVIPEQFRKALDERVLEHRIPDNFDTVKSFADIIEKAKAHHQFRAPAPAQ